MVKRFSIDQIPLDGGVLCLDFVNTVHDRKKSPLEDYLGDMQDLLYWAKKLKIISERRFSILLKTASRDTGNAGTGFKKALELRELLYRIFLKISSGVTITHKDLAGFNETVSEYFTFIMITNKDKFFEESWSWEVEDFRQITAPVVKSAYELILSNNSGRIKECPNCGWLFLDSTKNGKRRWCSMKNCGSTVKALEYYYRQKGKQ